MNNAKRKCRVKRDFWITIDANDLKRFNFKWREIKLFFRRKPPVEQPRPRWKLFSNLSVDARTMYVYCAPHVCTRFRVRRRLTEFSNELCERYSLIIIIIIIIFSEKRRRRENFSIRRYGRHVNAEREYSNVTTSRPTRRRGEVLNSPYYWAIVRPRRQETRRLPLSF